MGLMDLIKKKPNEEELAFQEENRKQLANFNVTKSWGVKKVSTATQFIYDGDARQFVVVEGPDETFRERNPYIISFDQVKSVSLEIDEYWTETNERYAPGRGYGILTQDKYNDVFWRYDFYLTIDTTHPYAGTIRYKMNAKTTITKVPNRNVIFFRKGFELGGTYESDQLKGLIQKMEQLLVDEAKAIHGEKMFDTITQQRPDSILERLAQDAKEDMYLKRIDNMTSHVKRAERIARLLLNVNNNKSL